MPQTRTRPGWVIEYGDDEELGTLRSGKEAGCFLVRRTDSDGRWCLLVRKDYRRRSDREYSAPVRAGERGLRRDTYNGNLYIPFSRDRRAVAKLTAHGREVREGAIAGHEFATLRTLWEAGAKVPYPVGPSEHGFYMQYVGTLDQAAPRLADVRLDEDVATKIFDRVVDDLHVLARVGVVHGDLSAYNILVQHGRPWIIDVPQAVDLFLHPEGHNLFQRDVTNLCTHFARLGVHHDPVALTEELLNDVR
jgi:RIO kinase 1